ALRLLGTARTGAYFSVAPLFGVLISFVIWPEVPGLAFWLAAALMALGVWLHLRERHEHEHTHEPLGTATRIDTTSIISMSTTSHGMARSPTDTGTRTR